jgi:putative flavoprotein involved in K+ transport
MESRRTSVVVAGAGPAGLALSAQLVAHGVDHVVLERGQVAHAWRTQRWDSLRLLTPNWMTRLPQLAEPVGDPDGFMTAGELAALLQRYRDQIGAPVHEHTAVDALRPTPSGFEVGTDAGAWRCRAVVIATGASRAPRVPPIAAALPGTIDQLTALEYRNPDQLRPGGVLVVGASASGVQIADELRRAGREVAIAAGDHVRLPRTYRGRDIYWWMDAIGLLAERHDEVPDLARARRLPSAQLVGSMERRSIDLGSLAEAGVQVVGRLAGVAGSRLQCSGSLANLVASADLKQARLLDRIDDHVARSGLVDEVGPPDRPAPVQLPTAATELDASRYDTVIWATGYRQHHPWLDAALLDRRGQLRHDEGVTPVPGVYALGLPFLRQRRSGLLDGIGADAGPVAEHLLRHLAARAAA